MLDLTTFYETQESQFMAATMVQRVAKSVTTMR